MRSSISCTKNMVAVGEARARLDGLAGELSRVDRGCEDIGRRSWVVADDFPRSGVRANGLSKMPERLPERWIGARLRGRSNGSLSALERSTGHMMHGARSLTFLE